MTRLKKQKHSYSWLGKQNNGVPMLEPVADIFLRGLEYHPDNIKPVKPTVNHFEGWTDTAIELWGDTNFLRARVAEQQAYCLEVGVKYRKGHIDLDRKIELLCSAIYLQKVYAVRLKELGY